MVVSEIWEEVTNCFIRLGKDWDGGYLVDQAAVQAAHKLVSFGINDEWSFESAFLQPKPSAGSRF